MGVYDSDNTSKIMKRQIHDTRNAGRIVDKIVRQEEWKKRRENRTFKEELISQDGKVRCEIQGIIRRMVEQEKSIEEIIETLNASISYQKFASYFQTWIETYQKKREDALEMRASKIIKPMLEADKPLEEILEKLSKSQNFQGMENRFLKWVKATNDRIEEQYRKDIRPFILRRLQKGAITQDILEDLKKRPEYTKYATFYSTWIEQIRMSEKSREVKEEER